MVSSARSLARLTRTTPFTTGLRTSAPRTLTRQQPNYTYRRGYASGATASSSSGLYWGLGAAAAAGGAGYYAYSQGFLGDAEQKVKANTPFVPKAEDYQKVYDTIAQNLQEKDDYDDGSYGPVLLRLAWHASGTYDKMTNTGGSNGATMRFAPEGDHGANAGLKAARGFLEPVKGE